MPAAAAAAAVCSSLCTRLASPRRNRVGLCGNGICEVGERPLQGLVEGSCPQDCSFATKVGGWVGIVGWLEAGGLMSAWLAGC